MYEVLRENEHLTPVQTHTGRKGRVSMYHSPPLDSAEMKEKSGAFGEFNMLPCFVAMCDVWMFMGKTVSS